MRVIVADDSLLIREGLVRLLGDAGCEVVGSASDAVQLFDVIDANHPDVVVVDIKMPPTFTDEGIAAACRIRDTDPEIGVLVLSQHLESEYAMRLLADVPERERGVLR